MLGGEHSQNMFRPPVNVLTLRSLVVSIRTAMLNTESSAVRVCMCCVWFLQQRAIISLHSIYRLVFVMETHCVLCEVINEYL